MNTSSQNQNEYFNLTTTGLGYLNRVRTVTPKKGEPFLACVIAALYGPCDKPEYQYFDLKVVGKDAEHLVRRCEQAVAGKRKVLLGFRFGDLWKDRFTYTKGPHAGETDVSLKGRLLYISWIKIDGQVVYTAPQKENPATQAQTAQSEPDVPVPAGEPAQPAPLPAVSQVPVASEPSSEVTAENPSDTQDAQVKPAQAPAETVDSF